MAGPDKPGAAGDMGDDAGKKHVQAQKGTATDDDIKQPARAPGAVWASTGKEKADPKAKEWPFPAKHYQPAYTTDLDALRGEFGDAIVDDGDLSGKPVAYIDPARAFEILKHCHGALGFDHLPFVSCADYPEEKILEMHWQLYSYDHGRHLVVKAHLDRDGDKRVPSVSSLWLGANWHEREMYDMFGVHFEGHPYLRRLFLPDGWRGHPLLKDYDETEQFIGMDEEGNDVVYDTPGPGRW